MKKVIVIILTILGFTSSANSAHIVGGESWVEQTGRNTFKIGALFYRDCAGFGSRMPTSMPIRIFDNVTNIQVSTGTLVGNVQIDTLVFGDACFSASQIGLCVSKRYFETTITLPDNPNGYYFTYRTPPNRKNSILNIDNLSSNVWYTQFPDPGLIPQSNSSPRFVDYPADAYLCVGNEKKIDFSCTDADGDRLVYSLITPIDNVQISGARPFIPVNWELSHNLLNILGPGTRCIIDSNTGIVTARSGGMGDYVIAVKCEEYRNGTKIGEVIRDMVLTSLNCPVDSPPTFANFETVKTFKFDETGCFDVMAFDKNFEDTFNIDIVSNALQYGAIATLPIPNAGGRYDFSWKDKTSGVTDTANNVNVKKLTSTRFEGIGRIGIRFCWTPNQCEILSIDTFNLQLYGYSLGCDGSKDSISSKVKIVIDKPQSSYVVPNVFSPNGDGVNDEFKLEKGAYNRCYDALSLRIYNRWGQLVFESKNAQFTWNGRDENGNELSEGTYFVVLQGYYGGREVTENFPLTLFR